MFINQREKLRAQKGFTLVELMIVIAIIGILVTIVLPKFTNATDSAKKAKIEADLRTIDSTIVMYYAANGRYPATITILNTDGYLTSVPTPPSQVGATDVTTYGIQGASGDTNVGANRAYVTVGSANYDVDHLKASTGLGW